MSHVTRLSVKGILSSVLLGSVLLLSACGQSANKSEPLKVGVIAGPEADLMKVALVEAKKEGLNAKLIEFTDYMLPNAALADGSIDVNAFQHKPYLDHTIKERKFSLQIVGKTFIYPIGAYSSTLKTLADLPDGAKVAMPNDPTNEGRSLMLLATTGLITLKDSTNAEATPQDVVTNPKHLQFVELDAAQLPRSLKDVDLAFINSTYAVAAGLLPTRDALLVEKKDSPYVNLLVSRTNNANDPRIAKLRKAYHSQAVLETAQRLFKGGAVPGWESE